MIYNAIYIITYSFNMFYIRNFMTAFYGNARTSGIVCGLSYLSYPLIVFTVYFTFNIPVLNLLANAASLFIISLNYNAGMLKRIISSAFIYLFMASVEVGAVIATGYFNISVFQRGNYSNAFGIIASSMILYISSLIVHRVRKKQLNEKVKTAEWIAIILIPVLSMYLIIVLLEAQGTMRIKGVLTVAAVLTIDVIVFYLYDNLLNAYNREVSAIVSEKEREYYYNQCKYMEAGAESARSFRHDIKNHMLTIAEYIKSGNSKRAEEYIYTVTGERLNENAMYSNTGNVAIDSVINFKLSEAESRDISVEADIDVPSDLPLDPSDITSVIGNLTDNAITAAQQLDKEERKIYIDIYFDKGRLFIQVINAFDGTLIQSGGKLITRKSDKDNHGFGLKNVEKIMEKYDGYIEYDTEEKLFKVTAMMYIKSAVNV